MSGNVYSGATLQKTVVNRPINDMSTQASGAGGCYICSNGNYCYTVAVKNGDTSNGCAYTNSEGCEVGPTDNNNCYYNGTLEDWHFDDIACPLYIGGNTPQCSTVDSNVCVLTVNGDQIVSSTSGTYSTICNNITIPCTTGGPVANEFLTTSWFSGGETHNKLNQGRNVRCDYKKDLFTENLPVIQSYYDKFANPSNVGNLAQTVSNFNDGNYNVMMQDFASTISTDQNATCPNYILYPYNDVQPETCNKLVASGSEGDWTRNWAGGSQISLDVVPYTDNAKNNYCVNNIGAPECACINRAVVDDSYNNMQSIIGLPAQCWYSPCQDQSIYLVTSDIADLSVCPQNVCQIVNQNIADSGGVVTETQEQNVNCQITNNDGTTTTDNTTNGGSTSDGSDTGGGLPTWLWIVIIAVVGLLIVGGIILLVVSGKKKE